jgi:hypothetical protein
VEDMEVRATVIERRKGKRLRGDSGESDCRRPRERNAWCRKEDALYNNYAITVHAIHRPAEALDNIRPRRHLSLILLPLLNLRGTVAEWLWRHV